MNKRAVTVSGYVIFVSLFCQMKNQYIFRVIHIQCPPCFRPDGERGGRLWARVGGVACSSVITVPSHFPTHW